MPSPFPGMDPWIEGSQLFPDLHERLLINLSETLNRLMPPQYSALVKSRIVIDPKQHREPDVSVLATQPTPRSSAAVLPLLGMIDFGMATLDVEEVLFLEILSDRGQRLVTSVEMLSPSNKTAGTLGRKEYQQKQQEMFLGGVNLVEIDLLRAGLHTTAIPKAQLQSRIIGPLCYHIAISRAEEDYRFYAAPLSLEQPLPAFGIPLLPEDNPVVVDFQSLFNRCYDGGRYANLIDYTRPPTPPLTAEQQLWADEILRAKGVT